MSVLWRLFEIYCPTCQQSKGLGVSWVVTKNKSYYKRKQVTEIGELSQRTPFKSESLMMSIE